MPLRPLLQQVKDQFRRLLAVQQALLSLVLCGLIGWAAVQLLPAKAVDCRRLLKADNADVIRIENGEFNPPNLTVPVCDTVLFLNLDSAEHWPKGTGLNAGHALAQFDYYQVQVTKTGTYSFNDYLHQGTTGQITVQKLH